MKNWEKYEEELRKIGVNLFALIDGEPRKCSGSYCRDCEFHKQNPINGSCSHERTKWLYQDDGIRVGDVVQPNLDGYKVLVYVTYTNGDLFSGIGISSDNLGMTYSNHEKEMWTKTNKHVPLDKVIELIGGTK